MVKINTPFTIYIIDFKLIINIFLCLLDKGQFYFLLTSAKRIQQYIQNQLKEDKIAEQMELELEDPFTGRKK